MNLYECRYEEQDWVCYVFAETRGKAKCLFNKFFSGSAEDFMYAKVRFIGKSDRIITPTVVDSERHEDYSAVLDLCDGYEEEEE